jgi:tellurite resistance protein
MMVTMSAVDRTMTDAELSRIGEIVSNLPVFDDFDQDNLVKTAEACGEVLSKDGGLDRILLQVKSALPKKLRETAYAIALEVAAADREVKAEETRFLEMLSDSLELDKLTTAGIERGIRARNLVL